MIDIRPVLLVIGVLLTILAIAMIVPCILDLADQQRSWQAFAISAFLSSFVGGTLILSNQGKRAKDLNLQQAFILTTSVWLVLVSFAALPFYFSDVTDHYTNAFFEAMSGLTTTGATVFVGLDDMPHGILLWRAILQWLGGIGIIVMAMAVLPMLKIGGMQLFRTESSDKSQKILPRATQLCGAITSIYTFFTLVIALLLWLAGMTPFDAICHAMTTIATAGFSNHDASIGYFNSQVVETIIIAGMLISALPYVQYIQFVRGRPHSLLKDVQVRGFFAVIVSAIIVCSSWLVIEQNYDVSDALRVSAFNIVSITTTTGYASADYYQWGSFAVMIFFFLGVCGGCTGSTTGGIKIFRFQILWERVKIQINQLIQPHGIFRVSLSGKPVADEAISSVMSFVILFSACFAITATLLSATGLDYITSMSAAASSLANLGPALGDVIGPAGNYNSLSDFAKWVLASAMLIGRLEIFTIMILFAPSFWRN